MRQLITGLLLLVCVPGLVTCSSAGANSGLSISLGQSQVLFINASTSSCQGINAGAPDTTIQPVYFQLQNMTINWTNASHPLTVQWVEFKTTDPNINGGAPYAYTFGGNDLMNTWIQQWDVYVNTGSGASALVCNFDNPASNPTVPQTLVISSTAPATPACNVAATTNNCPFKVGGITMTNPHQTSSGQFQAEIYATYDSGGGNLIPLVNFKTFTYFYQGI